MLGTINEQNQRKMKVLQRIVMLLSRIGDDIIFSSTNSYLSVRSLNESKSALPVCIFGREFFDEFSYKSKLNQISYQISSNAITNAMKSLPSSKKAVFKINEAKKILTLVLTDEFEICHKHKLFIEDTVLLNAVYNINSYNGSVTCRCNLFDGINSTFRTGNNATIQLINSEKLVISTESKSSCGWNSMLTIRKGEFCEISNSKGTSTKKVEFCYKDLAVGIGISQMLCSKMSLEIPEPGNPIIIKASMATIATFEMALATITENPEEDLSPSALAPNEVSSKVEEPLKPSSITVRAPIMQNIDECEDLSPKKKRMRRLIPADYD